MAFSQLSNLYILDLMNVFDLILELLDLSLKLVVINFKLTFEGFIFKVIHFCGLLKLPDLNLIELLSILRRSLKVSNLSSCLLLVLFS